MHFLKTVPGGVPLFPMQKVDLSSAALGKSLSVSLGERGRHRLRTRSPPERVDIFNNVSAFWSSCIAFRGSHHNCETEVRFPSPLRMKAHCTRIMLIFNQKSVAHPTKLTFYYPWPCQIIFSRQMGFIYWTRVILFFPLNSYYKQSCIVMKEL